MVDPTSRLLEKLLENNAPVVGVQLQQDGTFKIDYTDDATQNQIDQVEAFVTTYVDKRKRSRPINAIYSDLRALSPADFQKAMAAVGAVVIRDNPTLATKIGINIPGDEDGAE
jgi:hypothetical protein